MDALENRHELIEKAVKDVQPGRLGWKQTLKKMSEALEPHTSRGRVIIYHELLVALKKDIRTYRRVNDLSMEWQQTAEDEVEKFFNRYVTEPILSAPNERYYNMAVTLVKMLVVNVMITCAQKAIGYYVK